MSDIFYQLKRTSYSIEWSVGGTSSSLNIDYSDFAANEATEGIGCLLLIWTSRSWVCSQCNCSINIKIRKSLFDFDVKSKKIMNIWNDDWNWYKDGSNSEGIDMDKNVLISWSFIFKTSGNVVWDNKLLRILARISYDWHINLFY